MSTRYRHSYNRILTHAVLTDVTSSDGEIHSHAVSRSLSATTELLVVEQRIGLHSGAILI